MVSCIETLESMKEVFPYVYGYYGIVTTFFQPWGFVLASKKHDPMALTPEEIEARFAARGVKNRYYTGRFHSAVYNLPEYLHEAKRNSARILTDAEPFVWTA
jgi:spermidine synthase